MSAPGRRPARGAGSRAPWGRTWWGRAWVDALEQRARLDPNRLPRGRTYARRARVGALTVESGEVRAPVLGSRASAYRVRVRVRAFTPAEWDAVLDAVAARAAHAAALLDGELTPEVADDVRTAGLDLLPVAGEVGTSCSCPDWANPCKHAAAVCYLIADLLDDDPFVLLALRGRRREEVVAGLRARRAGGEPAPTTGPASGVEPGVAPAQVWRGDAGDDGLPSLPERPAPTEHPGRPAPVAADPPAALGFRLEEVVALAEDASRRAHELAGGTGDGGLTLDADADLARRAAAAVGTPALAAMASRAGRSPRELVALAVAWRHGGPGAVAVATRPPATASAALEEARATLMAAGTTTVRRRRGALGVGGGVELRRGADGLWYRLERRGGDWEVAAPPDEDPAALVEEGPVDA